MDFDPHSVVWTFDDGPSEFTLPIATALAEKGLTATFFMVGPSVEERPEVVDAVLWMGHEVGNHCWSHQKLSTLDAAQVGKELRSCQEALSKHTDRVTQFRPPYGDGNEDRAVLAAATALGLGVVMWDIDTSDYQRPPAEVICERVTAKMQQGSIILMHDGGADMSGEDADRSNTVEAVRLLLAG
jgi:peptidoglycan/xylan/chitin deacetylase (PgdA/CDA1 family)